MATQEDKLAWVERVATFFAAQYGVPAIMGRIQGWLMVCEPAQQSAGEIADAIGASPASLTTNLRLLIEAGFVVKLTRSGRRVSWAPSPRSGKSPATTFASSIRATHGSPQRTGHSNGWPPYSRTRPH
jgi:hypothetical protein